MIGGVSYISKRYSNASNRYLKPYNSKQESKHIIYLDANNICSCSLFKFLPTDRFKWINLKEFDSSKYSSNSSKDCVLEVDLDILKSYGNYIMIIL